MDEWLDKFFAATGWDIVQSAVKLSGAQNPAHIPPLLEALSDPLEARRWGAIYALAFSRSDKRFATSLIRILLNKGETEKVRTQAAECLANEPTSKAVWPLIHSSRDRSADVRFWCAFALGHQFRRSSNRRRKILRALEALLTDQTIPKQWLGWSVGMEALAALQMLDPTHPTHPRYEELIRHALKDPLGYPELWRWATFYVNDPKFADLERKARKALKIAGFDPQIFPHTKQGGARLTPKQAAKLPYFV